MNIDSDLTLFGISVPLVMGRFQSCRTIDEVKKLLKEVKYDVWQQRRQLAKELHPDVKGDHDKMAEINSAYDRIMKLKVEIQQPVQVQVHVYTYSTTVASSASYWTTSSNVNMGGPTSAGG